MLVCKCATFQCSVCVRIVGWILESPILNQLTGPSVSIWNWQPYSPPSPECFISSESILVRIWVELVVSSLIWMLTSAFCAIPLWASRSKVAKAADLRPMANATGLFFPQAVFPSCNFQVLERSGISFPLSDSEERSSAISLLLRQHAPQPYYIPLNCGARREGRLATHLEWQRYFASWPILSSPNKSYVWQMGCRSLDTGYSCQPPPHKLCLPCLRT